MLDALSDTQTELFQYWVTTTRQHFGEKGQTWACEILSKCRTANEHLPLPCSINAEANEIGYFLESACYFDQPAAFFRLYLILLSEFVATLEATYDELDLRKIKKPKELAKWANKWAKHRRRILTQHHPGIVFADRYGNQWEAYEPTMREEKIIIVDRAALPIKFIDISWFQDDKNKQLDFNYESDSHHTIVVIPKFRWFLDQTISYYRKFVDNCLNNPQAVRRFAPVGSTVVADNDSVARE